MLLESEGKAFREISTKLLQIKNRFERKMPVKIMGITVKVEVGLLGSLLGIRTAEYVLQLQCLNFQSLTPVGSVLGCWLINYYKMRLGHFNLHFRNDFIFMVKIVVRFCLVLACFVISNNIIKIGALPGTINNPF